MTTTLHDSLALPNGAVLTNRLVKAAMEENLADHRQAPDKALYSLYKRWSEGGAGLLLSGNVMIDARALTGPGGIVLEDDQHLDSFQQWAKLGTMNNNHFWMQLNHPGRQIYAAMEQQALGPSAVAVDIPGFSKMFAAPRAMLEAEILDVIARFQHSAVLAERAGFTGIQVHAAHGYLLSQFLSPVTNLRQDRWGGSLENRARLLIEVIQAVRRVVSPQFCVGVKLNSADFQRGGFDHEDALSVVNMLNNLPIDLLELSGGSYESPAMQGRTLDGRTLAREAYFLDFAREVKAVANMPIMVTGGIRRREVAESVMAGGVDLVGMGTALAFQPDLPKQWQQHEQDVPALIIDWKNKTLASAAVMAVIKTQLIRMSRGLLPKFNSSPLLALVRVQLRTARRSRQYRRWMSQRGQAPK